MFVSNAVFLSILATYPFFDHQSFFFNTRFLILFPILDVFSILNLFFKTRYAYALFGKKIKTSTQFLYILWQKDRNKNWGWKSIAALRGVI